MAVMQYQCQTDQLVLCLRRSFKETKSSFFMREIGYKTSLGCMPSRPKGK